MNVEGTLDALECELNESMMRLTHLQPHVARTDSTTAAVYVPEGPYQLGHSKNRRPDLPMCKIALFLIVSV
jgi:hypothetical protein